MNKKFCKNPCKKRECPLFSYIEVPYDGNPKSKIAFIGESPGRQEIRDGKPFVGESGTLLKDHIKKAGIDIKDCFFMNSTRCPLNKDKLSIKDITTILKVCRSKVELALKLLKPKAIAVLGDIALRQILHKSGITKARGKWLYSQEFNCHVLPMFHPAYILRNMAMLPRFQNDLKMLSEFIKNDFLPLSNEETLNYSYDAISLQTLAKLLEGNTIAIDTETQGLDTFDDNFLVLSFSISHKSQTAYQINLYRETSTEESDFIIKWERKSGKKRELIDIGVRREPNFNEKLNFLRDILSNRSIKKYMMSPYDLLAFYSLFKRESQGQVKIENFAMDIQASANILNENLYTMASLDTLQKDYTNLKIDYNFMFDKDFDKGDMLAAKKENTERFNEYACYDADVTRRVGISLRKELLKKSNRKQAEYLIKFVMPTIKKTMYEMTKNGIMFDLNRFPQTRMEIKSMVDRMEKRALKYIPQKVLDKHKNNLKLSRGDILRDALFSQIGYGLPIIKQNKTTPSIDATARKKLLEIRGLSSDAKKCIELYDHYREVYTIYTRNLKKFDKYVKSDERIHSRFSLVSAVTGRMASSDPNLMNIPKRSKLAEKIRKLLCASPGYLLLATDVSQSELRWIAHVAEEPTMMEVFRTGKDIHTETAKALVGKDKWSILSEDEHKKARRGAKAVNFGLIYCMGIDRFMDYVKKEYGITLSRLEAIRWRNIFFNFYNRIPVYHKNTIAFCKKYGYVESCLGRKRRLPEIHSKDQYLRGLAERQAINHRIQSPSSDAVLLAGNDFIDQRYPEEEARIVLFIHDELIFEIKENKVDTYAKVIKNHMENPSLNEKFGIQLKVPLSAGIKIGPNLRDLEEI